MLYHLGNFWIVIIAIKRVRAQVRRWPALPPAIAPALARPDDGAGPVSECGSAQLADVHRRDNAEPFGTRPFDLGGELEQQIFPAKIAVKLDADR